MKNTRMRSKTQRHPKISSDAERVLRSKERFTYRNYQTQQKGENCLKTLELCSERFGFVQIYLIFIWAENCGKSKNVREFNFVIKQSKNRFEKPDFIKKNHGQIGFQTLLR